jgi:DNA-binding NtrC family response regulator
MDIAVKKGWDKETVRMSSVLVVDQDKASRDAVAESLKKYFGLVEYCDSLSKARDLHQRCFFDLIVVEIGLPDGDVIDWVHQLREQGETTAIIFIASDADVELTLSALRADVHDFLLKPVESTQLKSAVDRFQSLQQCRMENKLLRRQVEKNFNPTAILGESKPMQNLQEIIQRIAPMPSTVLIEGESGTGKELAARALHDLSGRSGSFVPLNCGGMSAELMESELFGHARGAFTGAHQSRDGLFSFANKGTLFLDEIGEMPLAMQAHLLRVIEERSVRPVGSNQELPVDVRIVAATNRSLAQLVKDGRFRKDLFYRLNVVSVHMPPLRNRIEDIPLLARHFCQRLSIELGVNPPQIGEEEIGRLANYEWPGNVRELKNVIERCLLLNHTPSYCLGLPKGNATTQVKEVDDLLLASVEKQHILRVLDMESGNKSATARQLGVSRKTLERKFKAWGIEIN